VGRPAGVGVLQERRECAGEEDFARRVAFDVGAHALPGVGAADLRRAKLAGREVEEGGAERVAGPADGGEEDGLL
jgi:hypothetical protein